MSKLSSRLRETADWIDRMRDGPGVRELIAARLRELADAASFLEDDAEQMQSRLQGLPLPASPIIEREPIGTA